MIRWQPPRADGNYDPDEVSDETAEPDTGPSLTVQSQSEDADINVIVKRFGLTGELPLSQRVPLDVDVDELVDYRECVDRVLAAQASFNSMPAELRARVNNDPAALVDWVMDPANKDEARRYGLLRPEVPSPAAPAA